MQLQKLTKLGPSDKGGFNKYKAEFDKGTFELDLAIEKEEEEEEEGEHLLTIRRESYSEQLDKFWDLWMGISAARRTTQTRLIKEAMEDIETSELEKERVLINKHGTVRWFGPSWHAPICVADTKVATPVGEPCQYCNKLVLSEDQGLTLPFVSSVDKAPTREPWHLMCFLTSVGIRK